MNLPYNPLSALIVRQYAIENIAESARRQGSHVAFTNGCFDILHPGHIDVIRNIKSRGFTTFVGVNSDRSVRELKGPKRPIQNEIDRASLVACIKYCSYVFIFDETRVDRLIRLIRPELWFKGGDYTVESLDQEEVKAANEVGAQIEIIPTMVKTSTSEIIKRIMEA